MTVGRLERLRAYLEEVGVQGLVVTQPDNRAYLSGFVGTAGALLVTAGAAILCTDFRYRDQAAAQAPGWEVVQHGTGETLLERLGAVIAALGLKEVGFEPDAVTYADFQNMARTWPRVHLRPLPGAVERLRRVKEPEEVAAIRRATAIAEEAYRQTLPWVRPGAVEREVAAELEYRMRRLGADGPSFPPIVASGPRSALPHGQASDRVVQEGDLVTLDFGCLWGGYASDLTRTVVVGEPTQRQREVFEAVLAAQEAALAAVRAGVPCREVDRVARELLSARGLGESFGHGLGHGLGRAVHEAPRLAPSAGDEVLEAGMVVTIEPGAYISGWGGVRIEDAVVVTADGCENLVTLPKALQPGL
ncbi:MAG: aminopeptidase P family protein [Clostridia bacterium]|nr:aminopeptidase P family protein [Clostridia bacterium]